MNAEHHFATEIKSNRYADMHQMQSTRKQNRGNTERRYQEEVIKVNTEVLRLKRLHQGTDDTDLVDQFKLL